MNLRNMNLRHCFIAIFMAFSFVVCVALPAHAEDIDDTDASLVADPLENLNRGVYKFNDVLDKVLLKPIAKTYQAVIPETARRGIRNVLNNLGEPLNLINSVIQLDKQNSFASFWRFTINSTLGIGGIFDVAKAGGLENRKEDFGQSLGIYGTGQGAYIMLPLLGPSNVRDAFGRVADVLMDPFSYVVESDVAMAKSGIYGIDTREANLNLVDHIQKTSLDPYATIKSLYTQKRWDDIRNGSKRR